MKTRPRILRRILGLFRPYRWQVFLVFLSILATAALGLISALLIRVIFDDAIPRADVPRLALYAGLMFLIPVVTNFFILGQALLSTKIGQSVMRDLRTQLYAHLQRMSLRFYAGTHGGEVHSRLTNDIQGIQGIVTSVGPGMIGTLSTLFGLIVAMCYFSVPLTILSFSLLPVFLLINHRVGQARRVLTKQRQETLAQMSTAIGQTLSTSGMLLLKAFGRQDRATEQFRRHNEDLISVELRQQMIIRRSSLILGVLFAAMPAIVYLIGGWQIIRGADLFGAGLTIGSLVAFTTLQSRSFAPAGQLLLLESELRASLAIFERIFEYLDLPIDIVDRPDAVRLDPAAVRGEIVYSGVSFTYSRKAATSALGSSDAADKKNLSPAVTDVSFTIQPGQIVALVGPSGAGKTTIAHLLPRFYDVDSGVVTIDGHDVRAISLESLAELVGIVTQETYLLHASIRENLLFARPGATDAELIAAAEAAAIHDRIMECEQGYDTLVGENGYKFSGGEKQRLSIARAILKNPPVLVLDEATSALDTVSERLVQDALGRLMQGRTTLVIAHRLSTVIAADLIIVVDKGKIAEKGTHSELLQRGGSYSRLYQQQLAGALD